MVNCPNSQRSAASYLTSRAICVDPAARSKDALDVDELMLIVLGKKKPASFAASGFCYSAAHGLRPIAAAAAVTRARRKPAISLTPKFAPHWIQAILLSWSALMAVPQALGAGKAARDPRVWPCPGLAWALSRLRQRPHHLCRLLGCVSHAVRQPRI